MSSINSQIPEDPIELRPTKIFINLSALKSNFQIIKKLVSPSKVMPVVKANAYGHGLLACAQALEEAGADALAVAFLEEGILLRKSGVKIPILVMSAINKEQIKYYLEFDLDLSASSVMKLNEIEECATAFKKKARVHIDIDTGMRRTGVYYKNANNIFEASLKTKYCEIVGVMSHYAMQDKKDLTYTKTQLERFLESLRFFEKNSLPMPIRHISATGAILQLPQSNLDLVRPGLCIYGAVSPEYLELKKQLHLQPVMRLSSKVVYFKTIKKGEGVSYDHTWVASEDTRIATIAVGYGDGYLKSLSNKGEVLIRGKRFNIAGKVCMDQLMVNLGPNGEAYNNDEVLMFGQSNEQGEIAIEELAIKANTDPRELFVLLNNRIPRLYKR